MRHFQAFVAVAVSYRALIVLLEDLDFLST